MKFDRKRMINRVVAVITLFCMATQTTFAAFVSLATVPLFIGTSVPPMVMLNVPKDHQMFGKLYNDFADVNDDGVTDTGYDHTIDYYGYFDSFKCYTYTSSRFEPISNTPDKLCNAAPATNQWSGNFLNWVAMSRLDAVRKLLYGGFRTADTNALTVLERAAVPTDGHAWAKFYAGDGTAPRPAVNRLTPFNVSAVQQALPSTSTVSIPPANIRIASISLASCGASCPSIATVTTAVPHNLTPGMMVAVAGATGTNAAAYNIGAVVQSTPTPTTFTYIVIMDSAGQPGNNPGGNKTVARKHPILTPASSPFTVTSVTRSGCGTNCNATATVTLSVPHGLLVGMTVTVAGAYYYQGTAFNRAAIVTGVPSANSFQYIIPVDNTGAPATNFSADGGAGSIANMSVAREASWTVNVPAGGRPWVVGDMITAEFNATNKIEGAISFISGSSGNVVVEMSNANALATPTSLHLPITPLATGSAALMGTPGNPWTVTNRSTPGITICNTTNTTASISSQNVIDTNFNPPTTSSSALPLMRVAQGNFGLWAVSDGKMCQWGGNTNGNKAAESELDASRASPVQAQVGLSPAAPDYVVRVKVCDPALLGTEKCKLYENGNWKPIGLLQQYSSADSKLIQFGLMTPSYSRNKQGGVLRKQVSFLDARPAIGAAGFSPYTPAATDEVHPVTGLFLGNNGIIKTLNSIQIYGYGFNTGTTSASNYGSGDTCTTPGEVNPANGVCTSWGNPTSEMYIESLRYLAGKAVPDATFVPSAPAAGVFTDGGLSKDNDLRMRVQGWNTPVTNANWCAPLNVIVMNASVSSYDHDEASSDLFTAGNTAKTYTNTVGQLEGLTGKLVLTGSSNGPINSAPSGTDVTGLGLCTPKSLGPDGLGSITGICPEAPMLGGSYLMAGAAHWSRNNRIIPGLAKVDGAPIPATDFNAARVNTYGITLSGAAPRIKLVVPDSNPARSVTILPSGRTMAAGPSYRGTGSIVDFKVVKQNTKNASDPANDAAFQLLNGPTGSGKFFVSWEDSLQGNDYDLDAWGVISYQFLPVGGPYTQIRVTTNVIYGQAGFSVGFGYVISGVTQGTVDFNGLTTYGDGAHYTSAHRGGNPANSTGPQFNWPPANMASPVGLVTLGTECNDCQQLTGARSITFDIPAAGTTNVLLEEPLYYAAKYGGFRDLNKNGVRDDGEWDQKIAGKPDNYFLVTNPAKLEEALEESFISILAQASASSVATNSTSLQTGTTIYQARFNANDWSGQVLAFPVNLDGSINAVPAWDAGDLLKKEVLDWNARTVITYDTTARDGVPFRLGTISADLRTQMYTSAAGVADPAAGVECTGVTAAGFTPVGCSRLGQMRLNYLRGDSLNEGATATKFRPRPVTKLGDVVNSNPNFVGAPNGGFGDSLYAAFRNTHINRKPMIYVGANDGMLHAFSANEDGKEYLAYIPSKTFPNLTKLTDKAYKHRYFVDGSPEVGDAFFNSSGVNAWHTVLVGALGAGGQGVFALNITDPERFKDQANAAETVLWEFTDKDDPNLGYVLGQPVIRKMSNDKWAVIVSGGYNNSETLPGELACTNSTATPVTPAGCSTSTTGRGYLFVIFLDGPTGPGRTWVRGSDYIRISTGVGSAGSPGGLAAPFPADIDADGKVDFIYAGDLNGNMFKFDVRNTVPSQWNTGFNRVILYQADTGGGSPQAQPITSKAEGTPHPSGQGFIINFGTGKYLEPTDPNAPYQIQTYYGIWDKNDAPVPVLPSLPTISGQSTATDRSQLMEQTITTVASGGINFRVVSANVPGQGGVPNWSDVNVLGSPPGDSPPRIMGWFMDFPNSGVTGERSVFRPILTSGRLLFTTLIPNTSACESGGTSFLMVVDPVTGGRIDSAVLDVDANGQLNTADKLDPGTGAVFVSGVQSSIGITPTPTIVRADSGGTTAGVPGQAETFGTLGSGLANFGSLMAYALSAGSSGGNSSTMIGLAAMGGRVSWRELMAD
jgi:type IV pilus assembly protein PilY1